MNYTYIPSRVDRRPSFFSRDSPEGDDDLCPTNNEKSEPFQQHSKDINPAKKINEDSALTMGD